MGYAIAEAALDAGHRVVLISGRVSLSAPADADLISVTTSDEMYEAVHARIPDCDVLIMCAAVADYKPATTATQKIKKQGQPLSLDLIPTRDILASLPRERNFLVVGFAAETEELERNAKNKLRDKNCDVIVANDVSRAEIGMESADNEVTLFFQNGEMKNISRASKKNIARELVKIISNIKEKSLTKKTW